MALTLIKENGDGLPNANSYADVAEASAYHDGHLYSAAWSDASPETQAIALVMATRLIDALFKFNGFRRVSGQALQWPRRWCPDPDRAGSVFPSIVNLSSYVDEMSVPSTIVDATCEQARELIKADRTEDPDDEGLSSFSLDGAMSIVFNAKTRRPVVPAVVQAMVGKFGEYLGARSGNVKLVRT
jgi:hypothetical protein